MIESSDQESRTTYDLPEIDLPAKLFEGMNETHPFSGTIDYIDEEVEDERIIGEFQFKVVGLETVKVAAGNFENCVRLEGVSKSVDGYFYTVEKSISWYAKDVGLVKYELSSEGETIHMELSAISDEKPTGQSD